MYSDKLGARPVSIDKPTLRALSEKAWESLVRAVLGHLLDVAENSP